MDTESLLSSRRITLKAVKDKTLQNNINTTQSVIEKFNSSTSVLKGVLSL